MTDLASRADTADTQGVRQRVKMALRTINPAFVREGAADVAKGDVHDIVKKADEIEGRFSKEGPLGRFVEDGQLMLALVRDYWRREYRRLPQWTLGAVAFALLYVLNPLDLLPDALPGIGLLDDAAVISVCLLLVEQDLYDYKAWKEHRDLPARS